MKRFYVIVSAALVCFVLTGTAIAEVEFVGADQHLWFVNNDPIVVSYENLAWQPPPGSGNDKRKFHDDFDMVSINLKIERPVCWRLDSGDKRGINWQSIKSQLGRFYGIDIGGAKTVLVTGEMDVPCYTASFDVYTCYRREFYEVRDNGRFAVISVMTPINGIARVYRDLERAQHPTCAGLTGPQNSLGACASIAAPPGNGCGDMAGGDKKRHPYDIPNLDGETHKKEATWGKIKALYDTE